MSHLLVWMMYFHKPYRLWGMFLRRKKISTPLGYEATHVANVLNPNYTGLFWRLVRLGGGGGAMMAPPLEISAVDRAIAAKICTMVVCDVIYKTIYLDFPKKLYFILY